MYVSIVRDGVQADKALQRLSHNMDRHITAINSFNRTVLDEVLTPRQLARLHATCLPHLPSVTGMIDLLASRAEDPDASSQGSGIAGGTSCSCLYCPSPSWVNREQHIERQKWAYCSPPSNIACLSAALLLPISPA